VPLSRAASSNKEVGRILLRATLIAAAIATAAIGSASPTHADPGDAQFIGTLEQHGMGCVKGSFICTSDEELTEMGHSVCDGIDNNGITPVQAANVVMRATEGNLNKATPVGWSLRPSFPIVRGTKANSLAAQRDVCEESWAAGRVGCRL
jgi:Protein of unknown function (DUF732)